MKHHMNTSSTESVIIVIPARYGSSRLPGKPLMDIMGKPMVQHVYEKALKVENVDQVIIAIDDIRLAKVIEQFGGQYMMTSATHESGTDRLVEVMQKYPADIYINVQGDEPLIRPDDISTLVKGMQADKQVEVGTLYHHLPVDEASNPNAVKVVLADNGNALYFSRSPIPYPRDEHHAHYWKHVGVYGYRQHILDKYSQLPQPMLEHTEKLEQLRLLTAGVCIRGFEVEPTGPGVDTPDCLERVRRIMAGLPDKIESINPLQTIRLVITDVDGVLTNGSIFYNETGECLKCFHVRDGLGIRLLEESGIKVAVLSGRDSSTLRKRVDDLGVSLYQFGVKNKFQACLELMAQAQVSPEQTVCIGDDSIDLPAFAACGISYAVADAAEYVKNQATYVLNKKGGEGAFRELADSILEAQGQSAVFNSVDGFKTVMTKVAQ